MHCKPQFHRGATRQAQFSLQSFLPASGLPVSQAFFAMEAELTSTSESFVRVHYLCCAKKR